MAADNPQAPNPNERSRDAWADATHAGHDADGHEQPRDAQAGPREETADLRQEIAGDWNRYAERRRVRMVHHPKDKAGKEFYGVRELVWECLAEHVPGKVVPVEIVARIEHEELVQDRTEWRDRWVVRHVDLLWRAPLRDSWLYVLFPVEVQSEEDWTMPVRVLVTTALIYAELCKDPEVRERRVLPPVVPVVVYGGTKPWKSPRDLADLLPPEAEAFLPYALGQRFVFVAEAEEAVRLERTDSPRRAALRLRYARDRGDFLEGMEALKRLVPKDSPLRRPLMEWVRVALIERGAKEEVVAKLKELEDVGSPMIDAMWDRECRTARQQGLERGLEQGLEQGRREAEAATLVRQARRKFGPDTAGRLAALLAGISDPERTAEVADLIIDCASGRDLIERAGAV